MNLIWMEEERNVNKKLSKQKMAVVVIATVALLLLNMFFAVPVGATDITPPDLLAEGPVRATSTNTIEIEFNETIYFNSNEADFLDNITAAGITLTKDTATASISNTVITITLKENQPLLSTYYTGTLTIPGNLIKDSAGNVTDSVITGDILDKIVPEFDADPFRRNTTDITVNLHVDLSEASTVYYLVIPFGSTPPTAVEVKTLARDPNSANPRGIVVTTGNQFSANTTLYEAVTQIINLEAEKRYEVYIVAEDASPAKNLQDTTIRLVIEREPPTLQAQQPFSPIANATGVIAQLQGAINVYFSEPITKAVDFDSAESIKIIDLDTGDNLFIAGSERISSNVLSFSYRPLRPNAIYTVIIAPKTVRKVFGGPNPDLITWTFSTERKPEPFSFSFEPGGHTFPLTSPFGMTPDFATQYRISELLGVQKLGVRTNQTLAVDFMNPIRIVDPASPNITIIGSPFHIPAIDVSVINDTRLVIRFNPAGGDAFLNPSTRYTLQIEPGALQDMDRGGSFSYNEEITIEFMTADGFKTSLLDATVQEINTRILNKYSAVNIAVDVPKIYITSIETIHHQQGLIPGEIAPHLSHIDIMADDDVASIRLQTARGIRHLDHRVGGKFSATFAGLAGDISEITILAYDEFGKLLEERSFRLGTALLQNDYIPEITETFGRRWSLYDLMADTAILEEILTHIPVSQLDRIGIFYPFFSPFDNVQ